MNILFYLTRYPGIGGIENVTKIITSNLQSKYGHKVVIISHHHDTQQNGDESIEFMPCTNVYDTIENRSKLKEVLEKYEIDIIIYQDSYAPTEKMVIEIADYCNKPVIVFEHNSPKSTIKTICQLKIDSLSSILKTLAIPYRKYRIINRKRYLLKHCKRYILLSNKFIPEFKHLVKVNKYNSKIQAINNPITINGDGAKNIKDNIILFVGRLEYVKRLDICLDVWKELSKKLPTWKFVVVGDGSMRSLLEDRVKREQIKNTIFTGFKNPTDYYKNAKIFWMTSEYEGWGLTIVEAQTHGCVPIIRNTFSAAEDIIHNDNGILIDDTQLREKLLNETLKLIDDKRRLEDMAKAAILSTKRFSIENIIRKWQKILTE